MPNIVDITVRSTDDTQPVMDAIEARYKLGGQKAADAFTRDANGRLHDNLGRFAAEADLIGAGLADGIGTGLTRELPDKVEKPLKDSGKKSGDGFAKNMSPLLLSAFTGAATLGPVALIAGAGVAAAGIAAILARSNANIASEYQALGHDVSATLSGAVAPFAADIEKSINILDQGLGTVGPELKNVFAAAAPYSEDIANSLVTIVERMLPGFTAGLQEAAPIMQVLATFTGDIGQGVGDFVQKLGTGSSGAATGLQALGVSLEHILGDVGQIAGSLSNGLGPALHDVSDVALPLADGLAKVVAAFPPGEIRLAADAAVALFAAFKIASLAGFLAEGTTFVGFLKQAAAGEIALTGETGILATAMEGLGTAAEFATGPLGLLTAGVVASTTSSSSMNLVMADYKGKVVGSAQETQSFAKALQDAAAGSKNGQQELTSLVGILKNAKDAGADTAGGIDALDQSLTQFYSTNPSGATKEYASVVKQLGLNTQQAAAAFPKYSQAAGLTAQASHDAQAAAQEFGAAQTTAAAEVQNLTQSIIVQQEKLAQQAGTTGANALAALSFADSQATLDSKLADAIGDYDLASGAASAFKQAQDALYGKYASYSQAEATFTEDLANATSQLTKGKNAIDLSTDAGAKNFTVLNQLAQANEQVAESFIKQGGSVDDANKKLQAGALQIDNLARKAGFSADQVAQLNTELYGTANIKDIRVNVSADTSAAINSVNNTLRYIDNQVAYIQVQTIGGSPGGKQLLAAGGAVGGSRAQSGGPRGNVVTVGEHGIEDVQLPVGSTVFSHEDTMAGRAYAGAGGSGPTHLLVEWVGSGNEALDALWTALRGHIRFRTGGGPDSVQRALGQN